MLMMCILLYIIVMMTMIVKCDIAMIIIMILAALCMLVMNAIKVHETWNVNPGPNTLRYHLPFSASYQAPDFADPAQADGEGC